MARHVNSYATAEEFVEAYNSGELTVPYLVEIRDIKLVNKAGVTVNASLYSNRLPWHEGMTPPEKLTANCTAGGWILGMSKL